MVKYYTEKEHKEIMLKQYDKLEIGKEVILGEGVNENSIGYVSRIENQYDTTGLQTYTITDNYVPTIASYEERSQVEHVTVLFRGSTSPVKAFKGNSIVTTDAFLDWVGNNTLLALTTVLPDKIITGGLDIKDTLSEVTYEILTTTSNLGKFIDD